MAAEALTWKDAEKNFDFNIDVSGLLSVKIEPGNDESGIVTTNVDIKEEIEDEDGDKEGKDGKEEQDSRKVTLPWRKREGKE